MPPSSLALLEMAAEYLLENGYLIVVVVVVVVAVAAAAVAERKIWPPHGSGSGWFSPETVAS